MAFDIELLKKHPYATGGVVIVGGLGVFFVLSRGGSSAPASASAGNSDAEYAATLQAQSQMAQLSAATQLQTQQTQAQLSVAQLQAGVANNQIAAQQETTDKANEYALASALIGANASVLENANNLAAATTQQTNELQYAQNIQSMQDSVLLDQINEGYAAHANDNATQLAGLADTLEYQNNVANLQHDIASQGLQDSTVLGQQELNENYNLQTQYNQQVQYVLANAGSKQNSALDATDQTSIFQTVLSHGNPNVAVAGVNSSAAAAVAGDTQLATTATAIAGGASSILTGLFGGLSNLTNAQHSVPA
jgi:hypothetical protein